MKRVWPSGEEESVFADGTVQKLLVNGNRVIEYTNGQRETHTKDYKVYVCSVLSDTRRTCVLVHIQQREYPDGTVKTVFPDGRQETRYASGRVRVKDSSGHVLVDSWQQRDLAS